MTDLNTYATKIYEQNKAVGWWDDPNRCLYECLQLVSTEVAEATEGERKNLMDDHLPHRRMGEVELADALIRTLDLGGHLGLLYEEPLSASILKDNVEDLSHLSVGRRHLEINDVICGMARAIHRKAGLDRQYSMLVSIILLVAQSFDYDIIGAMDEKLEYNRHRADHKRENRAQTHGKRF